ncbi:MAG TPA: ComEC/Rec2 family competence protein [Bryobacteraceae bacterium]|nr:ComEC/Rec2 family competence protein [Bryobacteraceae bacterium]
MGDPLLLPAIAIAAGILMGRLLGLSMAEAAWPIAAFATLAGTAMLRQKPSVEARQSWSAFRLVQTCTLLALIFAGAFAEAWHRPGPPPTIDAGSRETLLLAGCVVEPTVFSPNREQFTLELDPHARARVSLNLRDGDVPQRLDYGQRVEIEARIRRPHNYNNPGSFDYAGFLARQYIFWTASMAPGSHARVLPGQCGSRFMAVVFALRVAALERIESLYGSDTYSTGMMEAILIGETSKLEKIWTDDFRRTGTFHALVISGVHVTVLAAVLLFLLRLCLLPEIPALAITAAAAWLYALVSGFSAPVVRAAGGFSLYLVARFFFRRGRVMNLLAMVAIVYLLSDPGQMFDASFQLSFLCVAAIGALASPLLQATTAPLAKGTRDVDDVDADPHLQPRVAQFRVELRLAAETVFLWTRIPRRWALAGLAWTVRILLFGFEMAAISTVVQIGLALPMAEYFHRVSFTGLTANILIVPLLNAVVPIGFAAIFTGWHFLATIAAGLLKVAAKIAAWHASIEPPWRVPDPPLWLALMFVAALITLAVVAHRRGWRWPAIAAVLASFAILLWHPWPPAFVPGTLELTVIDVGQGDSLLVAFPQGKTMLIDGGGVLQYGRQRKTNLDTGEDVVSPYLWYRGMRRIDVVVATHAHEDHSGGISALLENFRPQELWVGAYPLERVARNAARVHVPVLEKRASPPFAFSGATIQVLSPPPGYSAAKSGNNDSLALRITYGRRTFLLTGDMERPMEARLLDQTIQADVLKVGHHGSKTSTMQPFLDAVSPSVAVISAGFENSFGHPTREVLARLADRHAAVLRTDLDGLITVRTDGQRLWLDTMAWRGGSAWWTGERSFNWALAIQP